MLENAVALTMASDVGRAVLANRLCSRSPELVGIVVENVNHLTRRVGDRIVRQTGNLILVAVHRPCVTTAFDRDLEAERGIGDHIDPWRGCPLAFAERRHVFAAVLCKSAKSIEKLDLATRACGRRPAVARQPAWRRCGSRLEHLEAFDLLGKRTAAAEQHRSVDALKEASHFGGNEIGAQNKHATAGAFAFGTRTGKIGADQSL